MTNRQVVVGVSPIAYLLEGHWPKTNAGVHERYYQALHAFIENLVQQGTLVVLFTTDQVDQLIVSRLVDSMTAMPSQSNGNVRTCQISSVPDLFRELERMDFVVASRLHGVILSHLALLPVLALSYDRKVDTYMQEMNQARYCLDIHTAEASNLQMGLEALTANAEEVREELRHKTMENRSLLRQQYMRIIGTNCSEMDDNSMIRGACGIQNILFGCKEELSNPAKDPRLIREKVPPH
jgi:polysaccharide pyruvyl transferase WcaK-like protein